MLQRIYEMAAEGRYTRREIVLSAGDLVANGHAARMTVRQRKANAKAQGYQHQKQGDEPRQDHDVTRPGRWRIASQSLMQAKRQGHLIEGDDGIVTLAPHVKL